MVLPGSTRPDTPLDLHGERSLFGSNLVLGPEGSLGCRGHGAGVMAERTTSSSSMPARGRRFGRSLGRQTVRRRSRSALIDNQLVTLDADGMVVFLDVETGEERQRLFSTSIQPTGVGRVTFSHDGRYLARLVPKSRAGCRLDPRSNSGMLRRNERSRSFSMRTDDLGARPFSVSPDGSRMAMASGGLNDLEHIDGEGREGDRHERVFTDVSYSPDGPSLAGATFTGWIGLWDPATGLRGRTLSGHRGEIHRIGFSPDGRRLVSAGRGPGRPDLGRLPPGTFTSSCGVMNPRSGTSASLPMAITWYRSASTMARSNSGTLNRRRSRSS